MAGCKPLKQQILAMRVETMGPTKAEVWLADLTGSRGHEQKKQRPAAVWKDLSHVGIMIVIPFTTNLETQKFPYTRTIYSDIKNGLEKESVALVYQITSIDKRMLIKRIGELGQDDIKSIGGLIKEMLKV